MLMTSIVFDDIFNTALFCNSKIASMSLPMTRRVIIDSSTKCSFASYGIETQCSAFRPSHAAQPPQCLESFDRRPFRPRRNGRRRACGRGTGIQSSSAPLGSRRFQFCQASFHVHLECSTKSTVVWRVVEGVVLSCTLEFSFLVSMCQ